MAAHPYLEADGPIAFAHRGGAGVFPESSMRAFAHAASLGFTHMETDVRATADGVAVVFHDAALDRATDGSGRIAAMSWREVRRARVAGADPILRLEELLEEMPEARFNLDPKSGRAVEPLVEAIRRTGSLERVCVSSFSDRRTRRVRDRLGAGLCVGAGPRAVFRLMADRWPLPWPAPVGPPRCHAAQVPVRMRGVSVVTPGFVETAHRCGVVVHVWTIDDPGEMHRLFDLGVDGIMTDRPETLRRVMIERGCWPAAG